MNQLECMATHITLYDDILLQWHGCWIFELLILFAINVRIYTNVYSVILLSIHILTRRRNRKTARVSLETRWSSVSSFFLSTLTLCYFNHLVSKQIPFWLNLNIGYKKETTFTQKKKRKRKWNVIQTKVVIHKYYIVMWIYICFHFGMKQASVPT